MKKLREKILQKIRNSNVFNIPNEILVFHNIEQKQFLDKVRNQYKLNDAQTMIVVLALVQGKIRGDIIGLIHKTDPQKAGQEFIILMQDLDAQLKSGLSNDQYTKVKTDIGKLIKGQK